MNWYKGSQVYEEVDAGQQNGWGDIFGDVQRYGMDAYRCQVYNTVTAHKITISVSVSLDQFGTIVFQDFWKYDLSEKERAKITYSKIKKAVKDIFDKFETNEIPNSMLHSNIREAVRFIDIKDKPPSRMVWIDAARKQEGVADWRSSLYGNRYPHINGF